MAYASLSQLAAYMGYTFSSAQTGAATGALEAATAYADRYTGRTWRAVSPISEELCSVYRQTSGADWVYVRHRPVTTVTAVSVRALTADAAVTALASSQWELLDPAAGLLLLSGQALGPVAALVSYSHSATSAPADIQQATMMIAAAWCTALLQPEAWGVASLSVGQNDLAVNYADPAARGAAPAEALRLLDGYRRPVLA